MNQLDEQTEKQDLSCAYVIVTSDSCLEDPSRDQSGDYVRDKLIETELFTSVNKHIESDDKDKIISIIDRVLKLDRPALIITVGGTGLCPRDVTPDATSVFYEKICNGISTALHVNSLRYTPQAALSRLTAGIAGQTLIINFPGKLQACKECFNYLSFILKHALEQVRYDHVAYTETHRRQMTMANRQDQRLDLPMSQLSLDIGRTSGTSINENPNYSSRLLESLAANGITLCQKPTSRPSSITSKKSKFSVQSIEESRNDFPIVSRGQSSSSSIDPTMRRSRLGSATPSKRIQPKNSMVRANSLVSLRQRPGFEPKLKSQNNPKPGSKNHPQHQQVPNICPLPEVKILQTHSSYPQIAFEKSLDILESKAPALFKGPEPFSMNTLPMAHNVIGCTLAEDLHTKRILPPFPVSTMDGYVVNIPPELKDLLEEIKKFSYYPIVGDLIAFEKMQISDQNKFFCCQINTGGRLPKFNYAVVPTEKAERHPIDNSVTFTELRQFVHVRGKGTDIGEQDVIKAGTVIGPVELGCIIAMGHKTIKILPRPKIGILSTGDELENFFSCEPHLDSVVDTNGPMLRSIFRSLGYQVFDYQIARDEPQDLYHKISNMLKQCKVIIITGGASMGTRDHVKDIIHFMKGQIHFGRVNIKPGKPVAFASVKDGEHGKFIFSLPGNPVSAFVTTLVMVLPFLSSAPGRFLNLPGSIKDHLGENIWAEVHEIEQGKDSYKFEGRCEFLRAKILARKRELRDNSWPVCQVWVSAKQQSSRLLSLVDCDCLMMVEPKLKGQSLHRGSIFPAFKLKLKP